MININALTTAQIRDNLAIINNRLNEFYLRMADVWTQSDYDTSDRLAAEFKELTNAYHVNHNEPTIYEQLKQMPNSSIDTVFDYADILKKALADRG
jgi:hypothetical protein